MTPLRARLTLTAVSAIFLATATNALFLQGRARLHSRAGDGPSSAVSITQFPVGKLTPAELGDRRSPGPNAAQPAPQPGAREQTPAPVEAGPRLYAALQRELTRKGYRGEFQTRGAALRAAILVYEFDSGLPMSGEPSEELLKRLLFDLGPAPRGAFADRAELDSKLVLETQKRLLELGFFSGPLSAQMDVWTAKAIKAFERHRGIPQTGRMTEGTLLELINYSGQPLRRLVGGGA